MTRTYTKSDEKKADDSEQANEGKNFLLADGKEDSGIPECQENPCWWKEPQLVSIVVLKGNQSLFS